MSKIEKWMSYNKKSNHLIDINYEGGGKARCNLYFLDSFPSNKWQAENPSLPRCGKCQASHDRDVYFRQNLGRDTYKKSVYHKIR